MSEFPTPQPRRERTVAEEITLAGLPDLADEGRVRAGGGIITSHEPIADPSQAGNQENVLNPTDTQPGTGSNPSPAERPH